MGLNNSHAGKWEKEPDLKRPEFSALLLQFFLADFFKLAKVDYTDG